VLPRSITLLYDACRVAFVTVTRAKGGYASTSSDFAQHGLGLMLYLFNQNLLCAHALKLSRLLEIGNTDAIAFRVVD